MKIDRHNYEELFILYWDNELTAVERQAVENFVDQNKDLREEFEMLGEARFTPDVAVGFNEKDFLFNDSFINITNYEEQLLNYIDDEITTEERKKVEKFVSQNQAAQQELALFLKAKLQPEAEISFPDKSVLYHRGEKARVISMTWFRVAVAAAIIMIAGVTVFQFVATDKNADTGSLVITDRQKDNPVINNVNLSKEQRTDAGEKSAAVVDDQPGTKQSNANTDRKKTAGNDVLVKTSTNQSENKNDLPVAGKVLLTDEPNTRETEVIAYTPVEIEKVDKVEKRESGAINTSFTDTDVTNKSELALYIPEAEEKEKDGGGLKGFLRKTTRVFERRTKIQTTTEDNKLLVGAFAVSLK